ncbi:hypothetical protein NE865_07876 [Phthorimaea operculella]|nr:hypothetical protein NE865_07876 [Phthorimaea operculella]
MELSSKISSTSGDINTLFERLESFEERLKKATASQSAVHEDLPALSREFSEFKTLVWQVLAKLKTQTELLALGQDRHETFLRRKVLLLHGIAETKNEKVEETILDILTNQMQLSDFTCSDLQSCHRLGAASSKPRPVLVRFRDLHHCRLVWDTKTSLKDSGIVISEFLTKSRHDVFMAARKHFGVRNCWSSDGRITILLPDKSRRKVETPNELQSLTAKYPPVVDSKQSAAAKHPEKKAAQQQGNSRVPLKTSADQATSGSGRILRGRQT